MTAAAPATKVPAPSRQPNHRRPITHQQPIVTRASVCLRLIAQSCAMRRTARRAAPRSGARARSRRLFICNEVWRWRATEVGRKPRRSKPNDRFRLDDLGRRLSFGPEA
jgi:hypothetical protein